jgi:chemotaxis protein CheX
MNPDYIDPFLMAAVSTFNTMLGCKLTPLETFVKSDFQPQYEVSGVIGLSSKKARGTVVLSLSKEAALSATGAMLGERPAEINGDVTDAVGELTNIIAGAAKAKLEHLALDSSLPTTVVGKQLVMRFPQGAASICIPYDCPWGNVAVEVALVEGVESSGQGGAGGVRNDRAAPTASVPPVEK